MEDKIHYEGDSMSKKLFTEDDIKTLKRNPYVKSVTSKGITYTDEFKRRFITENEKGKLPLDIFSEHNFNIEMIGKKRIQSAGKRWRKAYKENGIVGLQDTRKHNTGRPSVEDLSAEEKLKRLEAENRLLSAENELLKKLEMIERGTKKPRN